MEDQQQCKLDQHFQTGNVYKADHSEQRCLVKSIALNLVVDCDLPVNIVSTPGFIRHHTVTNRMYNSVDRFVMQCYVNSIYYNYYDSEVSFNCVSSDPASKNFIFLLDELMIDIGRFKNR